MKAVLTLSKLNKGKISLREWESKVSAKAGVECRIAADISQPRSMILLLPTRQLSGKYMSWDYR